MPDVMKPKSLMVTPSPNWRIHLGYSHGMPQSSMVTFESFPSGVEAAETTAAFLEVISRILENSTTATLPIIGPGLQGAVATASALAAAAACLQVSVYLPVASEYRVGAPRALREEGRLRLVLPWWRVDATRSAYTFCAELWNRIAAGERIGDVALLREDLTTRLSPFVSTSVNEFALVKGITELGINLVRLPGEVLCLGTGMRSRWMSSTTTDATPGIGIKIARNKVQTAAILRLAGLPVAENRVVTDADAAAAAAAQFGGSVVVKPADLDRGDGVAADLRTEAEVRAAYDAARAVSDAIMVERLIPGYTHRLTVAVGEVISVRQRVPGGVTGDGTSTVAELVVEVQKTDRNQQWERRRGRPRIALDEEALALMERDGHDPDTVLPKGQFLRLRRRDNINSGGKNTDIDLAEVHRDNLDLAVAAARALRLDIAGIDLITSDITRSWRDVGASICEVNSRPQFAVLRKPEMFRQIIARVTGPDPHVPANLILCTDDPAERAAVVEAVNARAPRRIVSTREGLWRGGMILSRAFPNGYAAAIAAIARPDTEAMTCVMSPREVLANGSPLRRWARTNILQAGLTGQERALVPALLEVLGAVPTEASSSIPKRSVS